MYFRARYGDATTGEFISRDPLEYVDGMSLYRGYFVPAGVDPSGLEFKKLSDKEAKKINIHKFKEDHVGKKLIKKYDLYRDEKGNLERRPKKGKDLPVK